MVVTRKMLACLLNMDLELEFSSAIQYVNHASQMKLTPGYKNLSREIIQDAIEEFQHAIMISDEIRLLGVNPNTNITSVFQHDDFRQLIRHDEAEKVDCIRRYAKRIEQAEAINEFALAQHLRYILAMEQQQLEDFRNIKTAFKRPRPLSIIEIGESDNFEMTWQERALNVPIRTRKISPR